MRFKSLSDFTINNIFIQKGDIYCLNEQGNLHSYGEPALIQKFNDKYWFKNGKLHRLDGPAVEYSDGGKVWMKNGKMHNLNSWAWTCHEKEHWINGIKM